MYSETKVTIGLGITQQYKLRYKLAYKYSFMLLKSTEHLLLSTKSLFSINNYANAKAIKKALTVNVLANESFQHCFAPCGTNNL